MTVNKDACVEVTSVFVVPKDGSVGSISTIVITATSDVDGTQNSAVTRLVVIPDVSTILEFVEKMVYHLVFYLGKR